jgi:hypothetical protein
MLVANNPSYLLVVLAIWIRCEVGDVLHVNIRGGHRACTTSVNARSLGQACLLLLVNFMLTGATLVWTMAHLDFSSLPVDFGVVLAKPGKTKDDVLPP